MAIALGDNWEMWGPIPNFSRDLFTTLAEMKQLSEGDVDIGHKSFCLETGKTYEFVGSKAQNPVTGLNAKDPTLGYWVVFNSGTGSGIPIYDSNDLNELTDTPSRYLDIGNITLQGTPSSRTITVLLNGDYLNILFSAIRHLQAEVARLKNSFYYGLCSLIDGNTTSNYIFESSEEEELEPLWAIDPEDLSEIEDSSISIATDCLLIPKQNISYVSDTNYITINNEVTTNEIRSYDDNGTDAKVLFYSIIEPETNYTFHINLLDDTTIKLEDLNIPILKCNIMFICSRRVEYEGKYSNKNFYWINITSENGDVIKLHYFDVNFNLTESEQNLETISMFKTISMSHMKLFKLDFYTKQSSFGTGEDILPYTTDMTQFKLQPSHITIRSVETYSLLLTIKDRLLVNELIWCKEDGYLGLYIKTENDIISIGNGSGSSTEVVYALFTNTNKIVEKDKLLLLNVRTNSTGLITYTSSNTSIATVSSSGVVTAINSGNVVITANISADSKFGATSCTINLTVTQENTGGGDEPTEEPEAWKFGSSFPITFGEVNSFITFPLIFN